MSYTFLITVMIATILVNVYVLTDIFKVIGLYEEKIKTKYNKDMFLNTKNKPKIQ